MALTVEDGTGLAAADSFISVTDADTYFTNHGSPSAWTGLTNANKESALRYATLFINHRYQWPGMILVDTQALALPRKFGYDEEGRSLADDEVWSQVEQATCEAALAHVSNALNQILQRGGMIDSLSVGSISIDFSSFAPPTAAYPYIDLILSGIVQVDDSGVQRAVRA